MNTRIPLYRAVFGEQEKILLQCPAFKVSAWTYASGVLALSLENSRGKLVVLPYQGQMIWSAEFDGCNLTMNNLFEQPRPSPTVIDTYGCFMFHSGLLRNGCPTPDDTHALHGEMPCAPLDTAWLEVGEGFLRLGGSYQYAKGFGDRYLACPSVTLRADSALFDIAMDVTNLAAKPMDLMYMAHMNYAFVTGARFVEPLGVQRLRLRTSVPDHVKPTPAWSAYMARLAELSWPALNSRHCTTPRSCFSLMVLPLTPRARRISYSIIPMARRFTPVTVPNSSSTPRVGSCTRRISKWRRSSCRPPVNPRAITPRKPKVTCVCWRLEPALRSVSPPVT
jgi:hypothetical protein